MKKTLLALTLIFGAVNNSVAQIGFGVYPMMDMASMDSSNSSSALRYSYELKSSYTYLKSILTIKSALIEYNKKPYIAGEKPVTYEDLKKYRILGIPSSIKKNISEDKLKIDDLVITIKTNKERKLDILVENLSEVQCKNVVYSFKINRFKNIYLNNKIINQEDEYICLTNNSVEIGQ